MQDIIIIMQMFKWYDNGEFHRWENFIKMRVIICDNYEELSDEAAKIVAGQIMLKPDCTLGLATGSTPVGLYKKLCEMNKRGEIDFSDSERLT